MFRLLLFHSLDLKGLHIINKFPNRVMLDRVIDSLIVKEYNNA